MSKRIAAVVALVVIAAVVAAVLWSRHRSSATPDLLTLYGNVDIHESAVAFKVSGRIARLLVHEGDRVTVGQPLAELDAERFAEAVARAQAQVAAQQQQLAALEAGSRPEEIRRARAEVAAARASAENARSSYRRLRELLRQKLTSQEQVDTARAAADAAAAQQQAAEQALQLAEIGPRREDIAAARDNLDALKAGLALALLDQQDATLKAPVAGVVRTRILEPGEMASPQAPVVTIAIDNPVWVRAWLPEPRLGQVKPGMDAWITTDSYPGKRYQGWVGYISPTAEFTPKTVQTEEVRTQLVYEMRVQVCNPAGELRLGMPAVVILPLAQPAPPPAAHHCAGDLTGSANGQQ